MIYVFVQTSAMYGGYKVFFYRKVMAEDSTRDAIEEGRATLHLLEKQLQYDFQSDGSIKQNIGVRQSLLAERKLLDQKPRDARLQNRKGSPLGLTLEVLPNDISNLIQTNCRSWMIVGYLMEEG
jgi:hypothetical protein